MFDPVVRPATVDGDRASMDCGSLHRAGVRVNARPVSVKRSGDAAATGESPFGLMFRGEAATSAVVRSQVMISAPVPTAAAMGGLV
ncbi:MAG: hypothetical protein ACE5EX_02490 [Phycisphaerae bacterium]